MYCCLFLHSLPESPAVPLLASPVMDATTTFFKFALKFYSVVSCCIYLHTFTSTSPSTATRDNSREKKSTIL